MRSGLENVVDFFSKKRKIIISTHESPDADGIGAEIALKDMLDSMGYAVVIVNGDPVPEKLEFLDPESEIVLASRFSLPEDISEYSLVVLDTNSFSNTGETYKILCDHVSEVFIIDHHEGGDDYVDSHFVMVEASSASEIVYSILKHYGHRLNHKAAQALYAGILFDTGGFKYKKTSSATHSAAAELVAAGVKPLDIHEKLFDNNDLSSLLLKSRILSTLTVYCSGKLTVMELSPEMIRETNADFSQGETNINVPLSVASVQASVLIKQDVGGPLKVSMRTKGEIDVSDIAIRNGGGGHKNAAGFKSPFPWNKTKDYIISEMTKILS